MGKVLKIKERVEQLDMGESSSPITFEEDWPWTTAINTASETTSLVQIELINNELIGTDDKSNKINLKELTYNELSDVLLMLDESVISFIE